MTLIWGEPREYRLSHTNCDGAGHIESYATKEEAIAAADQQQAFSDIRGNVFGYRYHVHCGRRRIYTSVSRPATHTHCHGGCGRTVEMHQWTCTACWAREQDAVLNQATARVRN